MSTDAEKYDFLDFNLTPYKSKIEEMCKGKVLFEHTINSDDEDLFRLILPNSSGNTTSLDLVDVGDCKRILDSNFFEFGYVTGFTAIYSTTKNHIECLIRTTENIPSFVEKIHFSQLKNFPIVCSHPSDASIYLSIGQASKNLCALTDVPPHSLSLNIVGVAPHNQSIDEILTAYSDNVLFQLETSHQLSYALVRERKLKYSTSLIAPRLSTGKYRNPVIKFPDRKLETGPVSLYWYGRSAEQMPLLRFLAYYQSVEYAFPKFSKRAAHERVQTILKSPNFMPDNDADVEKIFRAIRLTNSGRMGDEKSQFLSVLKACLQPDEVLDFIQISEERKKHFTSKQHTLSKFNINLQHKDEIFSAIANRLYEIRCKIVHTKNEVEDGEIEVVLPYSQDIEKLGHDTDLMKFIAEQVISFTSSPLVQ
ncbi:hypothetical protein MQC82_04750 [Pseudomonas viridiflava]|uniref:hypothetical protein n=1 Tax=Pseudomonas viridiflava TaxID=33069 RepID=UPI001F61F5DE|nr:hypothetical protein [Pseudomonas viridiflava]MCI3908867.1 hypothetical protein [Pseudomonas viridiflava]